MAGPDDSEKIISDKNEEDITIKAEENGENSSITYTLVKTDAPRVLHEGDTIDIYVLASPEWAARSE